MDSIELRSADVDLFLPDVFLFREMELKRRKKKEETTSTENKIAQMKVPVKKHSRLFTPSFQKEIHKAEEWSRRKEFWRQNVLPFCVGLFICAIGYLQIRTSWICSILASFSPFPANDRDSRYAENILIVEFPQQLQQCLTLVISRESVNSPCHCHRYFIARLLETGWLHIIITFGADLLFKHNTTESTFPLFKQHVALWSSPTLPRRDYAWLRYFPGLEFAILLSICALNVAASYFHFYKMLSIN